MYQYLQSGGLSEVFGQIPSSSFEDLRLQVKIEWAILFYKEI